MQAIQRSDRSWRFPKLLLEDQLWLALMVWGGAAAFAMVVTAVVSFFNDISISAWEIAAGVAPWFVGIMSGWVMYAMVPLFIANGRTRRDSFIEWVILAAIYPVVTALLTTIGYLIEWVVYGIAGWPRTIEESHLFTSHTDVGIIFVEYLLTYGVWIAVGGFVGVSLYRSADGGWISLLPAALLIALTGSMDRGEIGFFGIVKRILPSLDPESLVSAIPMALAGVAIAVVLAWYVLRDMPLRNR